MIEVADIAEVVFDSGRFAHKLNDAVGAVYVSDVPCESHDFKSFTLYIGVYGDGIRVHNYDSSTGPQWPELAILESVFDLQEWFIDYENR